MSNSDAEKRAHYRIDDQIGFAYYQLPPNTDPDLVTEEEAVKILFPGDSLRHYHTMKKFHEFEDSVSETMETLANEQPRLHSLFRMQSQKLDYLCKELFIPKEEASIPVNVSLGGLAFQSEQPLDHEALLKMKLMLKPQYEVLILDGIVKRCAPDEEQPGEFKVSVAYNRLNEGAEKVLSRYIMYRQSEFLRDR